MTLYLMAAQSDATAVIRRVVATRKAKNAYYDSQIRQQAISAQLRFFVGPHRHIGIHSYDSFPQKHLAEGRTGVRKWEQIDYR
jgi:hypothetical protein